MQPSLPSASGTPSQPPSSGFFSSTLRFPASPSPVGLVVLLQNSPPSTLYYVSSPVHSSPSISTSPAHSANATAPSKQQCDLNSLSSNQMVKLLSLWILCGVDTARHGKKGNSKQKFIDHCKAKGLEAAKKSLISKVNTILMHHRDLVSNFLYYIFTKISFSTSKIQTLKCGGHLACSSIVKQQGRSP